MKRAILLTATITVGASSSIPLDKTSSSLQHLRGRDDDVPSRSQPQHELYQRQHRQRALQEPNPDNRYCGTNWQTAHDSCDTPCPSAKDEDCGPGMYCFGFVDCTPPEPPAQETASMTSTVSAAALPSEGPVPSPVAAPSSSVAAPTMPSSIAALPLAPSEPTTPAPFTIPGGRAWGEVHEALASVMLALIAVHVAAALWHQFILRDRALSRMVKG